MSPYSVQPHSEKDRRRHRLTPPIGHGDDAGGEDVQCSRRGGRPPGLTLSSLDSRRRERGVPTLAARPADGICFVPAESSARRTPHVRWASVSPSQPVGSGSACRPPSPAPLCRKHFAATSTPVSRACTDAGSRGSRARAESAGRYPCLPASRANGLARGPQRHGRALGAEAAGQTACCIATLSGLFASQHWQQGNRIRRLLATTDVGRTCAQTAVRTETHPGKGEGS